MAIRAMAPEDWPRVAEIYQAGIDTGLATLTTTCPPYEAWDAAHLAAPRLVLVDDAGDVAAWAALSPVSARAVYAGVAEVSIYVDPLMGGRGVGTRLLSALVDASEAAGLWTLQSVIIRENEASLRLHARCGFRMVGTREKLGRDRYGVWRDLVLLERRSKRL